MPFRGRQLIESIRTRGHEPGGGSLLGVSSTVVIPPGAELKGDISIGEHTSFNGPPSLRTQSRIHIGRFVAIGRELLAVTYSHRLEFANVQRRLSERSGHPVELTKELGPIEIESASLIGDRTIVLGGVRIGAGAIVGAGSVVTRSIPPFHVAAGNPARVLKARFSEEIIEALERIAWWDWSDEEIASRSKFFALDLTTVDHVDAVVEAANGE